ncbi:MAG TPA: response regulator, partial [Kofleriaceae bacterium]|nr:response regulator [Kofleriaceae bacterium]
GGLGLGLAIVRDLVRLHGGTVAAASDGIGLGAAFTVELPLLAEAPLALLAPGDDEIDPHGRPALVSGGGAPSRSLAGMKLLLVDDDAGSCDVLSEILRMHGAEVRTAQRAADGLAALVEFRPDVLLCDIAMPGEDGLSLISRVRALPAEQGGRIPAIAVTAMASRSDRRRALAAGFQLHLPKPATAAELYEAVRRLRDGLPPPADA